MRPVLYCLLFEALSVPIVLATPTVFWVSDDVMPGEVIMAQGGIFAEGTTVSAFRLPDDTPRYPAAAPSTLRRTGYLPQRLLQVNQTCVKFMLSPDLKPGVFEISVGDSTGHSTVYLNRPTVRFLQPTRLLPGLSANEAYPGAAVQVIGTNLLCPTGQGKAQVAIRRLNTEWTVLPARSVEKYSLLFDLPPVAPGEFDLSVHNGCGGPAAWSEPLRFTVRQPEEWPARVLDVRAYGAVGDDVHDDTPAVKAALKAAEENGGRVVYFPRGIYRLNDWIFIPQRTVLRGQDREVTWLKWPQNNPQDCNDVIKAAVWGAGSWGMENLSLMVRNADFCVRDLSYDALLGRLYRFPAPLPELASRMVPWGRERDVFLRQVRIQHLYLCGRPGPEFFKRWNDQAMLTLGIGGVRNFEVSDCEFHGTQRFLNFDNARITGNSFSNQFGGSWTDLAGRYVVFENNEIRGASSWRWHGVPLEYLYSAHNKSVNYERGEREAMTFDVNGLPGNLSESYWGSPIEVGNEPGNVFLRFPGPQVVSLDGCVTGMVPHSYRGGVAIIHAYEGGPGAGQTRTIIDNNEDTVFLDKPWDVPPDTERRKGYIEVQQPRGTALIAQVSRAEGTRMLLADQTLVPEVYRGLKVLLLAGPGAGQYREVVANGANWLTVNRPWAVPPAAGSTVAVFMLMRHAIVYDCDGSDTSAFSQLWGNFYDLIVDGCRVRRSQGIWALSGWFVQFRENRLFSGLSFHPGIGASGVNPEGNTPFAPLGFLAAGKVFDLQPPVPAVLGAVLRRNWLSDNHRIILQAGYQTKQQQDLNRAVFQDVVIDRNTVEHSAVGIQIDQNVEGVLACGNRFVDVPQPYLLAAPEKVLRVEAQ